MTRATTMPTGFRHYVLCYAKKTPVLRLADSFSVTPETIRHWLHLCGIPKRPASNGVDKTEIDRLLGEGKLVREVAAELKCSITTVQKRRKEKC